MWCYRSFLPWFVLNALGGGVGAFAPLPAGVTRLHHHQTSTPAPASIKPLFVSAEQDLVDAATENTKYIFPMTIPQLEEVVGHTDRELLAEMCEDFNLSSEGSKLEMALRLRAYGEEQSRFQRERRKRHKELIEQGVDKDGIKHILEEHNEFDQYEDDTIEDPMQCLEDDEDIGVYFFYDYDVEKKRKEKAKRKSHPAYETQNDITAPPIPDDVKPNEKGERSVTVYSSDAQNDLTAVAASQPGQSGGANDAMLQGEPSAVTAPWDAKMQKKPAMSAMELEKAKEIVTELVHSILSLSGAPGFNQAFGGGVQPYSKDNKNEPVSPSSRGFDPSMVPADTLAEASKALRAGRGSVLADVLREFELQAVGYDGFAADDDKKGGGHYRTVSQVRAFLEGYRKAEVRRICRETVTMLLNTVTKDGVMGLDAMLATMTKSSDDTGEAGELTDSLLDYLSDAIRKQERKTTTSKRAPTPQPEKKDEKLNDLWTVTEEDGKRVETLNPMDPKVKSALREAARGEETSKQSNGVPIPDAAPDKILLLFKMLRERIKAEAAFANDEKGRNLRILAYCLRLETDADRKRFIRKELQNSLVRLESFHELVKASIDYGQSSTSQLQPSSKPLDTWLLKRIYGLVIDLKDEQKEKAKESGMPKL